MYSALLVVSGVVVTLGCLVVEGVCGETAMSPATILVGVVSYGGGAICATVPAYFMPPMRRWVQLVWDVCSVVLFTSVIAYMVESDDVVRTLRSEMSWALVDGSDVMFGLGVSAVVLSVFLPLVGIAELVRHLRRRARRHAESEAPPDLVL